MKEILKEQNPELREKLLKELRQAIKYSTNERERYPTAPPEGGEHDDKSKRELLQKSRVS